MNHNEKLDCIEKIIDDDDLEGLLDLIAEVCSAKADHILECWQDESLAADWDGYAAGFMAIAKQVPYIEQV